MGMNICLLNVRELSDESFAKLMESAPNNSVIVLEDIDHYGNVTDGGGKVSLAGLLNVLDGMQSQSGTCKY